MKIAEHEAHVIEAGMRMPEAETGRAAEREEDFRDIMMEEVQQRTLESLEKENELCGLGDIKHDLQMQVNNPHLLNIHRRVMSDGSCIITEKNGSAQISHYCKRLTCKLLTVG